MWCNLILTCLVGECLLCVHCTMYSYNEYYIQQIKKVSMDLNLQILLSVAISSKKTNNKYTITIEYSPPLFFIFMHAGPENQGADFKNNYTT